MEINEIIHNGKVVASVTTADGGVLYKKESPQPDFEYVDLGLPSGTLWATCNVGANSPDEGGLLFQWGRTDGYEYGDASHHFYPSEPPSMSGKTYSGNEALLPADDAATANMGSGWRMPTYEELKELFDNCNKTFTTCPSTIGGTTGMKGKLYTSKINGKQLFIPAAGRWQNNAFSSQNQRAQVWAGEMYNGELWYIYEASTSSQYYDVGYADRVSGYSVRGVKVK